MNLYLTANITPCIVRCLNSVYFTIVSSVGLYAKRAAVPTPPIALICAASFLEDQFVCIRELKEYAEIIYYFSIFHSG